MDTLRLLWIAVAISYVCGIVFEDGYTGGNIDVGFSDFIFIIFFIGSGMYLFG